MSMFSDLLVTARCLYDETQKDGTVLTGEAENLIRELLHTLEQEVFKETPDSSGVQTSSDLLG